ncbi:MAG: type 4a pilus biogenesis protein PilO [Methylocystaceae bacterium]
MKLSRRELIMIMVMVWILIGAVYYYFIYTPERAKLEQLQQINYQLQQQKTGHKVITGANTENDVLLEYQQLLGKIPEKAFLPEVLALVNETANKSDTEISGINYGTKSSQDTGSLLGESGTAKKEVGKSVPYQSIPIEFEVRGDYYQIKSFIQLIENSTRLITINNIKLVAAAAKQAGAEPPAPVDQINAKTESIPQLVGSAAYTGDNLVMTIKLTAFYDARSVKGRSGVSDQLAPPSEPKENPYKK